jgi:carbamoyl-phosphate synthase large subunit
MVPLCRQLADRGFRLLATEGTAAYLRAAGLPVERINKVLEGRPHVVDELKNGGVDLVLNTTEGAQAIADSFAIREATLRASIPYYTTVSGARAAVAAIAALAARPLEVMPLQAYFTPV